MIFLNREFSIEFIFFNLVFFLAITCNMKECLRVFYFYIVNITKFG